MSKIKHTPGPWKLGRDNRWVCCDEQPGGKVGVAMCFEDADAQLISAAPDLADACEAALDGLEYALDQEHEDSGEACQYRAYIGILRTALAKAGRQL